MMKTCSYCAEEIQDAAIKCRWCGEFVPSTRLSDKPPSNADCALAVEIILPPEGLSLERLEKELISQALDRSRGQIKDAAELLGLTYKTLQYRLKKHKIAR